MSDGYYRVGQGAEQLGISSHKVRQLCRAGLINAEFTGSQWRIPVKEVERLLREEIPPVPKKVVEDAQSENYPSSKSKPPSPLLGSPSEELVRSSEEVLKARNQVDVRKAQRELAEQDDFFKERQQKVAEQQAAARAQAASRQAQLRRQQWTIQWIGWAVNDRLAWVASGVPDHYRLLVRNEAEKALSGLPMDCPEATIETLLEGAIEEAIRPWRQEENRTKALEARKARLPYFARGSWGNPSDWEIRYRRVATQNFTDLRDDCAYEDMLSSCLETSRQIGSEYEHSQHEADLQELTPAELQDAKEVAIDALNTTDLGTSKLRLEKVRDDALCEYYAIINDRRKIEAHHIGCKKLVQDVYWELGHNAPTVDWYRAQRELKEDLDAVIGALDRG
jgi:excisionase family DNA binding protein